VIISACRVEEVAVVCKVGQYSNCAVSCGKAGAKARANEDAAAIMSAETLNGMVQQWGSMQ
jgi:hypothetical protein